MNNPTDQQLLRDYAACRSDAAFAELVRRHIDLVYSAALRMVRDGHLAEDVTQGAFLALAQNAHRLAGHPQATIASAPRIITLNGSQAIASVTRAVQVNGASTNTGVTLDITPNIEARAVALKIRAEFRELTQDTPPSIRLTTLEQAVKIPPGNMVELRKEIPDTTTGRTNSLLFFISSQIVTARGIPKPR